MKCPICTSTDLVMSERQGVEIDYCPQCRGIWLDRGELDKIIDKAISSDKGSPFHQPSTQEHKDRKLHDSRDYHNYRKKHWLTELFD